MLKPLLRHVVVIVVLCATSSHASVPEWSNLKCEACEAVMDELQVLLRNEHKKIEGRQDMDLLSRLDSKGKRQGKIVNYQMSELRALEVLETLRKGMGDYRVTESRTGNYGRKHAPHWFQKMTKYHDRGKLSLPGETEKDMQRALGNFCDMLIEEYEDELAAIIRHPKDKAQGQPAGRSPAVHGQFCAKTAGVCKDMASMGWFRDDPLYKTVLKHNADEPEAVDASSSSSEKADSKNETTQAEKSKKKKKGKKKRKKKRRKKKNQQKKKSAAKTQPKGEL